MTTFIIRRLLLVPVLLFGVTVVIFGMMMLLSPTERSALYIRDFPKNEAALPGIIKQYGLDDPFYLQYWHWMVGRADPVSGERKGGILFGDFGFSRTASEPVVTLIKDRFPNTLDLTIWAVAPVILFILFQRQYFVLPPNPTAFACFLLSLILAGLLQFFISYAMALLAFWVLEVSTYIFIVFAFEYLAGGHLFPLDILPPALQKVLAFTPFPYEFFFPVNIYLGRVSGAALLQGLLVQAAWVIAAYLAARLVWARGIRRYSAVGG